MGFQQFCVALVVVMLVIILPLKPNCGIRASVLLVKTTNTTYHHCNGFLNGCTIGGDDLESELEFFMASYNVLRFLKEASPNTVTGHTNSPGNSQEKCEPGKPYSQCIPSGDNKHLPVCNSDYTRKCKAPSK